MQTNYAKALQFVLDAEGGYSNDPGDNGGATNFGITHFDYDAYRRAHQLPVQDVRRITQAEVQDIYRHQYWNAVGGDFLPAPLDIVLFDCAVNEGVGKAHEFAKRAAGEELSELWADTTKALALKTSEQAKAIAKAVCDLREGHYRALAQIPHDAKFLNGWLHRLNGLRKLAGV